MNDTTPFTDWPDMTNPVLDITLLAMFGEPPTWWYGKPNDGTAVFGHVMLHNVGGQREIHIWQIGAPDIPDEWLKNFYGHLKRLLDTEPRDTSWRQS